MFTNITYILISFDNYLLFQYNFYLNFSSFNLPLLVC